MVCYIGSALTLQWRHNEHDGVSNYQPHDCWLNCLFRRRSKKISKLRVTGLCAGNSPVTGEFPAQMASNAENVSIWWRHYDLMMFCRPVYPLWYHYYEGFTGTLGNTNEFHGKFLNRTRHPHTCVMTINLAISWAILSACLVTGRIAADSIYWHSISHRDQHWHWRIPKMADRMNGSSRGRTDERPDRLSVDQRDQTRAKVTESNRSHLFLPAFDPCCPVHYLCLLVRSPGENVIIKKEDLQNASKGNPRTNDMLAVNWFRTGYVSFNLDFS